ncbi:uncharacterized protein V1516DRAFT_680546 [Lipomyces oligophaga]|uniref:uncharacterized protein n=1 Tax=Lipomyces oligophaga TaxID=45792 RepID=UPI0034CF7447
MSRNRYRVISICPESTRVVLAQCREHQTTLTGLVHALILRGLADCFDPISCIDTMIPISARRYLDSQHLGSDSAMGVYVFQFRYVSPLSKEPNINYEKFHRTTDNSTNAVRQIIDESIWNAARQMSTALHKFLETENPGWLITSSPSRDASTIAVVNGLKSRLGTARDFDLALSNLGAHQFGTSTTTAGTNPTTPHPHRPAVQRVGFTQPCSEAMSALKANVVGVRNGSIVVCLDATWPDVEDSVLTTLVDRLRLSLQLSSQPPSVV